MATVPSEVGVPSETGVDLVVVGGTVGGLAAAVTAAFHGMDVLLVDSRPHLGGGGLSAGGLPVGSGEIRVDPAEAAVPAFFGTRTELRWRRSGVRSATAAVGLRPESVWTRRLVPQVRAILPRSGFLDGYPALVARLAQSGHDLGVRYEVGIPVGALNETAEVVPGLGEPARVQIGSPPTVVLARRGIIMADSAFRHGQQDGTSATTGAELVAGADLVLGYRTAREAVGVTEPELDPAEQVEMVARLAGGAERSVVAGSAATRDGANTGGTWAMGHVRRGRVALSGADRIFSRLFTRPAARGLLRHRDQSRSRADTGDRVADRVYPPVIVAAKTMFKLLGLKIELSGLEHVPAEGGVVLAANHIGYLDFIFAGLAPWESHRRFTRFMAKEAVFEHKVSGPLMRGMHHIPVDREAGSASFRLALKALKRGEIVGLFPEATTSRSYMVKEIKSGAVRMAATAGVPLLPVSLWGTHKLWAKGRKLTFARGTTIQVTVGEPMQIGKRDDFDAATEHLQATLQAMLSAQQASHPDTARPGPKAWYLPAHLGGTAPTPEEAAELDAEDAARRRAVREAKEAKKPQETKRERKFKRKSA